MARSASGAAWLAPCRQFFSNNPKKLALRVRLLLFLDCVILGLIIAALTGPWYKQEWRVANGEILSWTVYLTRAKFAVDCSSDSPEFLDLCQTLYGRMAGDLRAVSRSICTAGKKVQDTDLQALLEETCSDMQLIEKLSVSTGALAGMSAFFMSFGLVAFLLHAGGGFRNRRAWRPPLNVAFDPAQAEPFAHELLYGFIIAIAASALTFFYLPFWWKAAPFDPDPYFLEPADLRQGFV
ncbi:hypothetical protein, conserved [Eimeria maxima]|uniref:Uncharacterized protein n=1 Tax=Eimeria maxima TaxID=5804 RepID=U6M2M2_EIMMA|nr:hypothetical protein, conserved [Eimeria maxima]CDJ57323.1 hypothetical protein, conserved [Eimeria maxima]